MEEEQGIGFRQSYRLREPVRRPETAVQQRARIGSSVRPGNAGQEGSKEVISSRNLVSRPAGAKPAWPGVSPPEPVVSLATGAVTRPAKRRHTSAWAVGNAATKSMTYRVPRALNCSKATTRRPQEVGEGQRTRRGGRRRHARHQDGPVTWEAHVSPRNNPVVRETRLSLSFRSVRPRDAGTGGKEQAPAPR